MDTLSLRPICLSPTSFDAPSDLHAENVIDRLPEVDFKPVEPQSGGSSKDIRNAEVDDYLGGMRNPGKATAHKPLHEQMALKIHAVFAEFVSRHPSARQVGIAFGSVGYDGPPASLVLVWREALRACVGAGAEHHPTPTYGDPSPLQGELLRGWLAF
eukprot:6472192-Amphidinium_carterae.1